MSESSTPAAVYKAIIDKLVGETRQLVGAEAIAARGVYSNAPQHQEFDKFLGGLSAEHRELVAQMLQEERDGAIHDVLAELTWWITTREVGLTYRGESMPVELSGMGLHGDFVGRLAGWEWPPDDGAGGPAAQ